MCRDIIWGWTWWSNAYALCVMFYVCFVRILVDKHFEMLHKTHFSHFVCFTVCTLYSLVFTFNMIGRIMIKLKILGKVPICDDYRISTEHYYYYHSKYRFEFVIVSHIWWWWWFIFNQSINQSIDQSISR